VLNRAATSIPAGHSACRFVGFYRTVAEPRGTLDPDVVVQLAGDYLWNPGTNSSVESGERAAAALTRRLRQI
jgi:protoporphyrinogen/coproporphyrinogen III oxidase